MSTHAALLERVFSGHSVVIYLNFAFLSPVPLSSVIEIAITTLQYPGAKKFGHLSQLNPTGDLLRIHASIARLNLAKLVDRPWSSCV